MSKNNYADLKIQLDEIIEQLEREDIDIDEAVKLHAQGQKIVAELETYLAKTKHKFEVIKKTK